MYARLLHFLLVPARLLRRVLVSAFGSVRFYWAPPAWVAALLRRPALALPFLLLLAAGAYASSQWYRTREIPRARDLIAIRKVKAAIEKPAVPGWNQKLRRPVPTPVIVNFDSDVAPLDGIGTFAVLEPAGLNPPAKGRWFWKTAQSVRFEPEAPLPAGQQYELTFHPAAFAAHTELPRHELKFKTPPLSASISSSEFHTDPTDPARHQAVVTVEFNQPVKLEDLSRHLLVDTIGAAPVLRSGSTPEVHASPESGSRFHLRSPIVDIPEREDFIRFRISGELLASVGGQSLGTELVAKVKVPTRDTGFHVTNATADLVPDADGEPQQFVFLHVDRATEAAPFAKQTEAWRLPELNDGEEAWTSARITPAVLSRSERIPLELVLDDSGSPHATCLAFRLRPRKPGTLWLRVPAGTPASGGFLLADQFGQLVTVPAFPKEVRVLGEGGVLALTGERKLSVKSRGFDHLRFTLGRVPAGQINHLVSQTGGNFQSPHFRGSTFGMTNIARLQRSVTSVARSNDHEASYSAFDFGPELTRAMAGDQDGARGLFFIEAEGVRPRTEEDGDADEEDPDPKWIALGPDGSDRPWGEDNEHEDRRFVLLTDLGLVVKQAADGKRDVFALSFEKRLPVSGVQVTALARNGEPLAEAVTDAQGRAELPPLDGHKREKTPIAILARLGGDFAFLPWARNDRAVELSRFDVHGVPASEPGQLEAFLFTERGVYRPGDQVQAGVIVRRRDWQGGVDGIPLRMTLSNAAQQVVADIPITLGVDGFAEAKLPTSETAATGVWKIDLRRHAVDEEEAEHLGTTHIRVEDFQPDRLKLSAKWNREPGRGWLSPDDLAVAIQLHTLFDLPAADRRLTAKLRVAPAQSAFEGWNGWRFHLPEFEPFTSREIGVPDQRTDARGTANLPLALDEHNAPLLRVAVDLEAFEADGGRGVQGGLNALVSRHDRLVGWKAETDLNFVPRDVPANLRLVALDRILQPVAIQELTRVLIESKQVSVLAKQENGSLSYVSQQRDQELERVDTSLPAGESIVPLPVGKAGRLRYEWRDTRGTVLCSVAFNVVGPAAISRGLQRDSELELALPKREWRAGENLEISVRAPYAGAGLITIERERVFAWKWFQADSASSIQHIAVPEGLEGGAYVHVAFVRRLDAPEIFANPLSVGVLPFKLSTERRQLPVNLDAPKLVQPGKPLLIGFSTPRPSRVIVWAVDDGIHRVTDYELPRPLSAFFQTPSLEVSTWQLLDLLLPEFSLVKKSRAFGGDGDEPPELKLGLNPFKRKRNAPVVFWSGILESGPERREVTYHVPDYFAGRINIMAVAVAPDALGSAESASIVKGPFVLTPNAPLFSAPGDEFIASLTIANQTEPPVEQVEVSATVTEHLEILESPEPTLTIAPNTEVTVRFRVRVKPMLGNAEIRFGVGSAQNRVELTSTLSVRPATPPVTRIESGWFREDSQEIEVGRPLYSEFARREAALSATPLGLGAGLKVYLRQFPHGCTEQTTSKAFPYLLSPAELEHAPTRQEAGKAIAHTCEILLSRQRSDGGFGYWTPANGEDGLDYLTIYVAQFLTEARAGGFQVPDALYTGALRRLKSMAGLSVQARHDANLQAAAIYLLTRSGEVTTNYALNLVDTLHRVHGEEWHRDLSAAWLAGTWSLLKMDKEARELIAQHRVAVAKPSPRKRRDLRFYECGLSDASQTFTVLCRHFPEIAETLSYDDLRPITDPIQRGEFHTHSAAWAILALKSYAAAAKPSAMELSIAENIAGVWRPVMQGPFALDATRIQFRRKAVSAAPNFGAWYQTIEFGFPKDLPAKPEARGLEVLREFLVGDAVVAQAKVGQDLRLRLRVRNLNAHALTHIALVDLFPAGFENAPNGLRPGLGTLPGATFVDAREDRNLLFLDLAAGDSRTFEWNVRPTCAGTFIVPGAFGEAMYDRAICGTGAAGQFVVLPQ